MKMVKTLRLRLLVVEQIVAGMVIIMIILINISFMSDFIYDLTFLRQQSPAKERGQSFNYKNNLAETSKLLFGLLRA
jgi:hypothetical protein